MEKPKTIFIDIDGTIMFHHGDIFRQISQEHCILEGVLGKFKEWDKKGHNIILTTGRRESMRELTEKQLHDFGLFWDQLIMGVGGGQRILINDFKPNSNEPTAVAVCVVRNSGLKDVEV